MCLGSSSHQCRLVHRRSFGTRARDVGSLLLCSQGCMLSNSTPPQTSVWRVANQASSTYLQDISYLLVLRNSHQEANHSYYRAEETLVVRDAPSEQQVKLNGRKASQW